MADPHYTQHIQAQSSTAVNTVGNKNYEDVNFMKNVLNYNLPLI